LYKGGQYAYPNAVVYNDYIYVIYSRHKETIAVTRIPLSEIV